jgi:phage antirepressor YoqD-like protein
MNAVILSVDGVPVTTSFAIAEGTVNDHASVIKLVRTYQADLEEFGGVGFEIQTFETAGGTQQREVAVLNEQQATLLITYMRNTDIVRSFKKRLVRDFWALRVPATPTVPQSLSAALRLAADQAELIETQQAQLAIAAPKAAFVDQYVEATGLKGFRQVAKLLKANEARLREFLIDKKILYRLGGEWAAYQPHIDAGRFDVKTGANQVNQHAFTRTLFTSKGVEWLAGLWAVHGLNGGAA